MAKADLDNLLYSAVKKEAAILSYCKDIADREHRSVASVLRQAVYEWVLQREVQKVKQPPL